MSYKGIPKKVGLLVNDSVDGKLDVKGGAFSPVVTGSGSLVGGYALVENASIGWHTTVSLTPASGTKTGALHAVVDAPNAAVHVSGEDSADVRRFSYVLFNPGLGTPKA